MFCWICHSFSFTLFTFTCLFSLICRLILICVGSNVSIVASGFADYGKMHLCLPRPWLTPWKGLVFPALHSFIIHTKCFLWQHWLDSPCRQQEEESLSVKLAWIRYSKLEGATLINRLEMPCPVHISFFYLKQAYCFYNDDGSQLCTIQNITEL